MSMPSHIFAVTLTSGERQQLLRLVEQHGTPSQREHLGQLVAAAPDLGSISALAATVEAPGRQPGSRSAEAPR